MQAALHFAPQQEGSDFGSSGLVSDHCRCWEQEDFRNLSIIPTKEDLFHRSRSQHSRELPINKVRGERYNSALDYIATHFFLLREDCMQALCQGIQALSQNKQPPDRCDLQVYKEAELSFICCGKFGIEYCLYFPHNRHTFNNAVKCLMEGSLLCLSNDGFQTFLWAIVSRNRKALEDGGYLQVRWLDDIGDGKLDYNRRYTVLESPPAFFEAYCHVLVNLQKMDIPSLPFGEHLVFLECQVAPPDYLGPKNDVYDLSCVFPETVSENGLCTFPVLQKWPEWESTLDPSQIEAVKHGITKRLALIQGPPGTGKTFVGTRIVKVLLNNLWRPRLEPSWQDHDWNASPERKRIKLEDNMRMDGPLLVLCYTNQALDQFLEGVIEFEENLIRYGGRSTSSKLAHCTAKQRIKEAKQGILCSIWKLHRKLCHQSDRLRRDIHTCSRIMQLNYVTFESLRTVATPEQLESLYFCGHNPQILELWLQGMDRQSVYKLIEKESSENLTSDIDKFSGTDQGLVLNDGDILTPENFNMEEPYLWTLDRSSRIVLHTEWLKRIKATAKEKLNALVDQYQIVCARKAVVNEEIQHYVLQDARVVGMTTTAAARCHSVLMRLKPKVIIVEEAAEILEGHVVACLTPYTEHLILIGDHLQLRPLVAVNKLAIDHNLDVSLFERLVSGGVEHVTLRCQRRMRPCISRLLHSIYPTLTDHKSVFGCKNVEGVMKNVFFLDHRSYERHALGSKSIVNREESLFVVELYLYILKQGVYKPSDITILTMYRAQMQLIKDELHERAEVHCLPASLLKELFETSTHIACVDDFQGKESNIIILSLVRNVRCDKVTQSIGFLENCNRVTVALSRAREGLYIFGNADLLASKSELWCKVLENLRTVNGVGNILTLICPNHFLEKTEIHQAKDFERVIDGGCGRDCDYLLDCGHRCPKNCHSGGHEEIVCPRPCCWRLPCGHQCMQKCHGRTKCPPCGQKVSRLHPFCHHTILVPCITSEFDIFQCEEPCRKRLICGHQCTRKCGQKCTKYCNKLIERELPCGHLTNVPCYLSADKYSCKEICNQFEPLCSNHCQGKCSFCRRTKRLLKCRRQCEIILPCGHRCKSRCSELCEPCTRLCENACLHRRCHHRCGNLCTPCEELCGWNCEHYQCRLKCYEVCGRPRCNEKCPKVLKCGHDCIGLCGEPCPIKCRICNPDTVEICSELPLKEMENSARFVELLDCGHLAEYHMLDALIDMNEPSARAWPKTWYYFCLITKLNLCNIC
ncbi:hypothetical protein KP509_04G006300 [Ceratopteris richardii]|uniref:NF-X1-type domain-containing protein n=2 Tax=Ceratopteris richardii TaxID=49495 RepID=A0A8T2UXL9_CERRI|nr:hypothetical protein KP509_04G006300 [Ceratopteris richardii]KAH7438224.1 hypothetical protein KP509_04G006300 [Ceratopteris richardii]